MKNIIKIVWQHISLHLVRYIIGVLLLFLTIIFFSLPDELSKREIRLYVWLFLIFSGVGAFANLRLYNAIVVNSQFIKSLREKFINLGKKLDSVGDDLREHRNKLSNLTTAINNLSNLFKPKK